MFAMTSGTTGQPKRLPITTELFREYKAGWRMWGAGAFWDHTDLLAKHTLQLTSDWQQYRAERRPLRPNQRPGGDDATADDGSHFSPAEGAWADSRSGRAALRIAAIRAGIQPRRNVDHGQSQHAGRIRAASEPRERIADPRHPRRLALLRSAARAAANPGPADPATKPAGARELDRLASQQGELLPKHAWPNLSVIAVWTGGSVNVYLSQLPDLYGETAIRDHGLSASEGRMTIPLADGTPAGILDFYHNYFEFIPVEEHDSARPTILEGHELEIGKDYFILLTTSGGLYRYDIHDVVRCVGFEGQAPLVEFLNKGKNFCSLTGEKLSEYQAVRAVKASFADLELPLETFTLAPVMDEHPRYVLLVEPPAHRGRADELAHRVQANLERLNEEYGSKCSSGRLLPVQVREVAGGTWNALKMERIADRGNLEEYKHPCLVGELEFVDRLTRLSVASPQNRTGSFTSCAVRKHRPMNKTVLVTGATGMVGGAFARRAAETGYEVRAMVRRGSDRRALDGVPVEFVEGDLADPESLPAALADAQIVIHTAAHVGDWGPAEKYRAINVIALEHMIHAAARSPRLERWVQISSLGVYPARHHYGTDESLPPDAVGLDGYTRTKAEAEMLLGHHIREHGFPAVILRPGIIYGPGDRHALPRFVEKINSGRMRIIGRGDRLINNTYVGNLVEAMLLAVEKPVIGETFNIRDERLVTREEFVNTIADYLGQPRPRHVPEFVPRLLVGPIEWIAKRRGRQDPPLLTRAQIKFMTLNLDYSIAKAKRVLGYVPQVDFRDGIRVALDDLTGKSRQPAAVAVAV